MVEVTDMTRPIVGIENRTAQEVFDIMCDRFRRASPAEVVVPVVYIIKDVLSELRKHKDASGTVWSGLNTNHPFVKDAVPLYLHPPQQEPARLREALESIARNTCCDSCREAALVARAALAEDGL